MVKTCPTSSYGASTGFLPIHIRMMKVAHNVQKVVCRYTLNLLDFIEGLRKKGRKYRIQILIASATTPPSLLGIERRIAYIGKKYHSGWMCVGVTSGFALIKFSGSISRFGPNRTIIPSINHITKNPTRSFTEK
jgi:hypothetical protein